MTGATAILVAGMHRSGTSALAGALNLLGVPLGQHLLEPGPDNPKGYWEHRDIVVVHERLLAALGSRWDDVRALPADWMESEAADRAAAAIGELVTRDFSGKSLWAIKDPRLCRFLPLWFKVLRQQGICPVVLFMVRDPNEVAASIEARNHWRVPIGEMLWLRYVTEAATASSNEPRSVVVYDDLLDSPLTAVSRALAGLQVEAGPAANAGRQLAGFIDKSDRHHCGGRLRHPASRFAEIAQTAYVALRSIAQGDDDWAQVDKVARDFGAYWQRHGVALDALADMSARRASDAESEEVENSRLSSRLDAQIRWSKEAQASREALKAENAGLASKLTAQIRWSEEAQASREALQAENAELASKLTAQIRWSEEAQAGKETLQAENAGLASKLTAQMQLSEQASQKQKALQAENAGLASKLTAQMQLLEQAAEKYAALQADKAELQSKLSAQINWSEQAQQRIEALQAELAQTAAQLAEQAVNLSAIRTRLDVSESTRRELAASHQHAMDDAERLRGRLAVQLDTSQRECKRLDGELATLQQRQSALETELSAVYASRSWRMTRPFRRVAGVFGTKASPDRNDKRNTK